MPQEKRILELVEAAYEVQNSHESEGIWEEVEERIHDLATQRNVDPETLTTELSRKYMINIF